MGKHRYVIDGSSFEVEVLSQAGRTAEVVVNGQHHQVTLEAAHAASASSLSVPVSRARSTGKAAAPAAGEVRAPMAGLVSKLMAAAGSTVQQGDPLLILDAMKMENTIGSPVAGVVEEVAVAAGATVMHGALLVRVRAS